jgi:hypothetical protein
MDKEKDYDAGDIAAVSKKKSKKELIQEREEAELKWVLSDPKGRAVMWRLVARCGVYQDSFTGNSTTFYKEGRRSVGLETIVEIDHTDKNAYATMRIEAVNRELENKNG